MWTCQDIFFHCFWWMVYFSGFEHIIITDSVRLLSLIWTLYSLILISKFSLYIKLWHFLYHSFLHLARSKPCFHLPISMSPPIGMEVLHWQNSCLANPSIISINTWITKSVHTRVLFPLLELLKTAIWKSIFKVLNISFN